MSFKVQRSRRKLCPFEKSRSSNRHPVIFFISYENHDEGLITGLLEPLFESEFQGHIDKPLYWKRSNVGGAPPWRQIYQWIRQCDGVLVLITQNAVKNPNNILREVRYARRFCKPIFPLMDWRLSWEELGRFKAWQKRFTFKRLNLYDEEPKPYDEFGRQLLELPDEKTVFTQILREHYNHLII